MLLPLQYINQNLMGATLVLVLLLCAATSAAAAQHKDSKIIAPSSLTPGTNSSVWLSSSKKFAFGFYETSNGQAVCIFLAGFFEGTVVWTANKIGPMLPNNVYSLELSYDALVLWQNRNGADYIYDPIARLEESIAWASMLDSGNFVLYNSNGRAIWQSFDNPTGGLLPGQRLLPGSELFSSVSETDPATGLFRMKMQRDGNLVQYPVNTPDTGENAYFASDTYRPNGNVSLHLANDGRLSLFDGDYEVHAVTSGGNPTKGNIYLARVDPDGIFRLYNRSMDFEDKWTKIWESTDDKCEPRGICGVNSFCSYRDEVVSCTCLPGFINSGGGCVEFFNVRESCRDKDPRVRYEMRAVEHVTWDDNYYDSVGDAVTKEDCGNACLDDCNCVVALFEDGYCRKQRSPLRYGRLSMNVSRMALVRTTLAAPDDNISPAQAPTVSPSPKAEAQAPVGLGKPGSPDGSGSTKVIPRSKTGISDLQKYALVGLPIGIALVVILSIFIIYHLRKRSEFCIHDEESKQDVNKLVLDHGSLAPKRYSYKEIKKITNMFAEKLGRGGYGIVYKGKLADGQLVAVKVLKKTHGNADEFVNEVASISRTSHVNIVNLLGFCFERKKRALVYQFMPNKSLDKFIYKSDSATAECSLEWNKLYEIAVGVARGLEYLHRGCNTRIIHFDIKPQNILLDQDFCPKISDFGLAKLCMRKQSVVSVLGTRGTIGYIAPEVFSRNFGVVSHKSDVYSYGIMLLQMAEARTNVEVKSFQTSENFFLEEIYEHVLVRNEKVYAMMTEEEEEAIRKMLMVGFWCIQTAPTDRPSMNNVVDMLESNLQCIQIPPLPFLLSSPKPEFSCLLPLIEETQSSTRDLENFEWNGSLIQESGEVCEEMRFAIISKLARKCQNDDFLRMDWQSHPRSGEVLPAGPRNGLSHLHLYQIIIKGVSIGLVLLVISTFIIYSLIKRRGEESTQNVNKFLLSHGSLAPTRYSYKEIRKITKSFTEKLGQGGYSIVYKGKLPEGQLGPVKVLRETHNNEEEFVNEVASISRTSHVNIVNLLGFCFERKKRALIYQFMPNRSLDKFIYKNGSIDAECSLEWNKLYEIAVGVARGLEYLHRGCNTRIVHFDIKPQNILLDEDFCPKISDFGLAKLCMKKQSVISMLETRGTVDNSFR